MSVSIGSSLPFAFLAASRYAVFMLNSGQRLLLVFANVLLGIIPSLAFFAWVERNASLPWIAIEWGWPWIALQTWPIWAMTAWNFGLILFFGALHTVFAQAPVHRTLEKWIPLQALRTLYLSITGLSLIGVMGLWQNTGIVLWSVPLGTVPTHLVSIFLFWSLMVGSGFLMSRFDPLQFLGLRQIYQSRAELTRTSGTPQLIIHGLYGRVRHPVYTLTLFAFALTPWMTLDRLTVLMASIAYLFVGIPIEEKKLIQIFGSQYELYRKRVPAVFPIGRVKTRAHSSTAN